MDAILSRFNEITNDEYSYLVLESVDVDIRAKTVTVNLIYPEPQEAKTRADEKKISDAISSVMRLKSNLVVHLTKSHFEPEYFREKFVTFMSAYPSVQPFIKKENVACVKRGDYDFEINVKIDDAIYDQVVRRKIADDVKKMIARSYCEKIEFSFVPFVNENATDYIAEAEEELKQKVYDSTGGHVIVPENPVEFIGKRIDDNSGYISDATHEADGVVYCGKVSDFTECTRKPKEGEEVGRKFYKFTLTDPTGSLKCLYFPRKVENEALISQLKDGDEVVTKGSLKENSFRGQKTYDMFVRAISYCKVPDSVERDEPTFKAGKEYKIVLPEPYVERTQTNMFDVRTEPPAFLRGKTFVVFDLETTGLDTRDCYIIEIGAVKVQDGVITETFSTYCNPHEHIDARITSLTSITDDDVENAPDTEAILPDFYKFSENATFVGHNVGFDIGFLNVAARRAGMHFDNRSMDTMDLARKYLHGLKNYKLDTVLKHFGLINAHAHRAIHDATATAKAFIKLCENV